MRPSLKRVSNATTRLAGRAPVGTEIPIVESKAGIRIQQRTSAGTNELYFIGGASSESFSGPRLAKLLAPAHEFEAQALEKLRKGEAAPVLSQHTSAGVVPDVPEFINALKPYVPWKDADDWFVSLQVEGASAVWAGIDLLTQLQHANANHGAMPMAARRKVAVGCFSYHGPIGTSPGNEIPLGKKHGQLHYPVPSYLARGVDEPEAEFFARIRKEQEQFLDAHAHELAVILVEPQWGISCAGTAWPQEMCREFIASAQKRGVYVLCDEIMCGLGRHGKGGLFLSDAWNLNPDAVTFGKAIATGVELLTGVILKHGRKELGAVGRTVVQGHTYAGSSTRALKTAMAVINEMPKMQDTILANEKVMARKFAEMEAASNGCFKGQGQGMLWGGAYAYLEPADRAEAVGKLVAAAKKHNVSLMMWPPSGGFIVCPIYDISAEDLEEGMDRIVRAVKDVAAETDYKPTQKSKVLFAPKPDMASGKHPMEVLPAGGAANKLSDACTSLSARETALTALMAAYGRFSPAAWETHVGSARAAGLTPDVINALAQGQQPQVSDREQAVFTAVDEILRTNSVSEQTYSAAVAHLGEAGLAELVSLVGYHSAAAMTQNVFQMKKAQA